MIKAMGCLFALLKNHRGKSHAGSSTSFHNNNSFSALRASLVSLLSEMDFEERRFKESERDQKIIARTT